jgi:GntR family transcriptional regulator/MocR family aminotransferase
VVYLGTTTKILTPALRVGWLVAGPELVARLAEAAAGLGEWAGGPAQRAVLSLIGPAIWSGTSAGCGTSTPAAGRR